MGFQRTSFSLKGALILDFFREEWNSLPSIEVAKNMIEFGSAITMANQIYVFGGMFADSVLTDSVFRYNRLLWEEIQKLSRPRSNHFSFLVQSNVIIHVSTAPDSIEQWIHDESSDTFLIENYDLSIFNDENADNSRPLIVPIVNYSSHWTKWSSWLKTSSQPDDGIWNRERCRREVDCQTQGGFQNIAVKVMKQLILNETILALKGFQTETFSLDG